MQRRMRANKFDLENVTDGLGTRNVASSGESDEWNEVYMLQELRLETNAAREQDEVNSGRTAWWDLGVKGALAFIHPTGGNMANAIVVPKEWKDKATRVARAGRSMVVEVEIDVKLRLVNSHLQGDWGKKGDVQKEFANLRLITPKTSRRSGACVTVAGGDYNIDMRGVGNRTRYDDLLSVWAHMGVAEHSGGATRGGGRAMCWGRRSGGG